LSQFQQQKGLVVKDERLDAESAKLNELTSQLTSIQLYTVDQRTKERSGQDTLPEVLGNSVVSGLRSEIARQEAKLKDASVNLGARRLRLGGRALRADQPREPGEPDQRLHPLAGDRAARALAAQDPALHRDGALLQPARRPRRRLRPRAREPPRALHRGSRRG